MASRIVSYLQDYKSHIIETWITEVELVPPQGMPVDRGELPVIYIEAIFNQLLWLLDKKSDPLLHLPRLSNYMDITFTCDTAYPESLACLEILVAGQKTLISVLSPTWDTTGEFSDDERVLYSNLLNKALAQVMQLEIKACQSCKRDVDCPFKRINRRAHWLAEDLPHLR